MDTLKTKINDAFGPVAGSGTMGIRDSGVLESDGSGILESKDKITKFSPNEKKAEIDALHTRFSEYGLNAKNWMRKCVLLLPEIDRLRVWEEKGFSSIYEYAAKLSGMNKKTVDEALRIMEKIGNRPELKKVVAKKGLWAVKPIISVATEETDGFWACKAMKMSRSTLRTYIREVQRAGPLIDMEEKNDQICFDNTETSQKIIFSMDLSPEVAKKLEKIKGRDWDETIEEYLRLRRSALESEKPPLVRTRSRHIPVVIERFIFRRSNKKCEFPNCVKDYRILHHADRFSLVWVHDPDRIFALCEGHERIAHLGLIENENLNVEFWEIRPEPNPAELTFFVDQKVQKFSTCTSL